MQQVVRIAPLLAVAQAAAGRGSADDATNPIQKVLGLVSELETKIIKEGEESQKVFEEYQEWCEDRSRNLGFEIKTGKSEVEELKATIESAGADASAASSKIEELAASLSSNDADLEAANGIREKETSDFAESEKDLVDTVSTLERAIGILERELKKGGASMMQLKQAGSLVKALTVMVDASMLNTQDASKLTALVQSNSKSQDEDDDADLTLGAPAAAVYEGKSGDIVSTLQDLLDKAKDQLDSERQKETNSKHNFGLLKQSLEDEMKNGNKEMADTKKSLASIQETKAVAEGDLSGTSKELAEDEKTKGTLKQDCMTKAQDFEAETKSRGEELKAIAQAKEVIREATSGAEAVTYGFEQEDAASADAASSFLQLRRGEDQYDSRRMGAALSGAAALRSGADLANFEAVRIVRDLARKMHSKELQQLAQRMAALVQEGGSAGGPFDKVKGMIKDMIERLLEDGQAEGNHKAYCDKEMSETAAKKEEKSADVEKLSTKIDSMTAKSKVLKEEVAGLQKALADLASSTAAATKLRSEEKALFTKNKADMDQGLDGVKTALRVLRDYYEKSDKAHSSADGAGTGIIGLLEVVESDLSKGLAEMTVAEGTSEADYEGQMQENKIYKATKEQDVKYKTKESKGLDQAVAEANSDRAGVQAELDAILEYTAKLTDTCVAKAETYETRAARRQAEIDGLKEALKVLEGESALIQRMSKRFRGIARHA